MSKDIIAQPFMITGSYTHGGSRGIYVYGFNSADGGTVLIDSAETENPSYLAVSSDNRFVYAVNETRNGSVTAFAFDGSKGKLRKINSQPSGGDHPCYVSIDQSGRWLAVGNYSSGSLSILPVQNDGSIGEPVSTITHKGKSVNPRRQEASHVHATVFSPDNKFLFVPDLGTDRVVAYEFDVASGQIRESPSHSLVLEPGSGPRHFEFHPSGHLAFLINELSGNVVCYRYDARGMQLLHAAGSLPEGYTGAFTSADIHVSPDGRHLYVSNRDELNTIAIFAIDPEELKPIGQQSTMGKTPRNFSFDPSGKFLLVANQNSGNIVVFSVDEESGLLKDTGKRIETPHPVCIKWIGTR